jgi:energy-coupling factor transport system permease protein
VTYRRRDSPLHAARAGAGSAFCVALAAAALAFSHPLVLACLLAAVLAAAHAARVGREVRRVALWGLPFAALVAVINPLVSRQGETVIARLGDLPPLGQMDLTLEATAYGGVLGLRALVVLCCFALHSAAVDPDGLLRAFRRLGLRSALTAALATRLVPVLARDARRVHEAQRCRGTGAASRAGVVTAVAAGALDRAVDVAATLEVRGYGSGGARARPARRPWSRHDLAFATAAAALAALVVVVVVAAGGDGFVAYPSLRVPLDGAAPGICALLALLALAPFAERRGVRA